MVSAETGIEFGLNANAGWSNNKYLENPEGWGLSVSKSISHKLSVRLSLEKFTKDYIYVGILRDVYPPIGSPDSTLETIISYAKLRLMEITIHHYILEVSKIRMDAGGGFGIGGTKFGLVGDYTGKKISSNRAIISLTFTLDITIEKFIRSPMALRIGFQYREIGAFGMYSSDTYEAFKDLSLSNVKIELLVKL